MERRLHSHAGCRPEAADPYAKKPIYGLCHPSRPGRTLEGGDGTCFADVLETTLTPDLISVPQMEEFTPPFRIVRRGDLPDIWDGVAP